MRPLSIHDDLVGIDDGRQAVRDDQRRAAFGDAVELAWIARSARVSSAEVASSKIRIGGFFRNARAIAMRCFSPPDSFSAALADEGVVLCGSEG